MAKAPATLTDAQKAAKAADRAKVKADNFLKLAPKRMDNTLKAMAGLRNLGNRASYSYTTEQREKIVATLKNAVNEVAGAYADDAKAVAGGGFSF